MESFLSLFVFHDTYVVSFLVVGITIVVVMLLLFNQKSPESVVKSELGSSDNIEGALRRVLGEKQWTGAVVTQKSDGEAEKKLTELESEVLEKDRAIADLNKQLTQSSGVKADAPSEGGEDLLGKINELEERLQEYEIIEDDIADLSLFRAENDKLKAELARLRDQAGEVVATDEPMEEAGKPVVKAAETKAEDDGGAVVQAEEPTADQSEVVSEEAKSSPPDGADLVAEFEKVVNNQIEIADEGASPEVVAAEETNAGAVVMSTGSAKASAPGDEKLHPKLRNVSPDSKEEAEVFISELKSLKKGS